MPKKKKYLTKNYRSPKFILLTLVALVLFIAVLEVTNTTYLFHKPKITVTTIPTKSPSKTALPVSQDTSTQSQGTKAVNTGSSTDSSANSVPTGALVAPSGNFVSNHYPGQNGSPNTEESTCHTTPFADCQIKFVRGTDIKTLPAQKTDSSGVADWQWDISGAGLTSGSWQITAVATANGQSKTTSDPIALKVQ